MSVTSMRLRAIAAAPLLLLLAPSPGPATQFLPATLEDMAGAADVVVVGTVVSSVGHRDDSRRGLVFTHVTVRVEDVLKGDPHGRAVEVVVPGGVDGESWSQVYGAPDLGDDGQRVMVFLYAERGPRWSNLVFWQGLFHFDDGAVRETGEAVPLFVNRVRDVLRREPSVAGGPAPAGGGVKR